MDDVFTYVEGGTNYFMPDTKDIQLPGKDLCPNLLTTSFPPFL